MSRKQDTDIIADVYRLVGRAESVYKFMVCRIAQLVERIVISFRIDEGAGSNPAAATELVFFFDSIYVVMTFRI